MLDSEAGSPVLSGQREHGTLAISKQGVSPYPLCAGSARPNPQAGTPETENPSCIGFTVLRGGLEPWSQTMVSKGARLWGRGRSKSAKAIQKAQF